MLSGIGNVTCCDADVVVTHGTVGCYYHKWGDKFDFMTTLGFEGIYATLQSMYITR